MADNYTTLYIRRHFEVARADQFREMRLDVLCDDGFVAYLNGAEVGRVNVSPDARTFPFRAKAAGNASEPLVSTVLSIGLERLRPGRNTVALQGFNVSLTSSDFSLIPSLGVVRKPDLERDLVRLKKTIQSEVASERLAKRLYLEARLLQESGERKRALEKFLAVLKRDPEHAEPYVRVAETLRDLGRAGEAFEQVEKALGSARTASGLLREMWFTLGAVDLARKPSDMLIELNQIGGEGQVVRRLRLILQQAAAQGLARVPIAAFPDARVDKQVRQRMMVVGRPISTLELARIYDLTIEGDAAVNLEGLEHCANLRWLRLAGVRLAGSRLAFASRLPHLRELELDGTDCRDDDLKSLKGLPELRRLDLSGTNVSDVGVRDLRRALPAVTVERE